MTELNRPTVPKWPFFLGDACLLGLAWFVHWQAKLPLEPFALWAICGCVALGATLGIIPFVLEYRLSLKLAEMESLTSVVAQVKNLEGIAAQIQFATSQWQTVQDHSAKTVTAATAIGEKMATEARAFGEFMQKANDTEKANLRLEVEKLRRGEAEWLQVVVRMLDHTYALHQAAVRSGKTALIEQLSQFQAALRDGARRVGLTPVEAQPGESFDSAKHQLPNDEKPAEGAVVDSTVATGYTFRGQQVRPTLVALAPAESPTATPDAQSGEPKEQNLL